MHIWQDFCTFAHEMKKTKSITYILVLTTLLTGCSLFQRETQEGVVAQLGTNTLTMEDINTITSGTTGADSAALAEAYIRQWAQDILVYDRAHDRQQPELEALVEDYRRSLYVHAYEQRLIARHMDTDIADSVISTYYTAHADQFILRESIVKGILLVIPQPVRDMNRLKKWLTTYNEKGNLEKIEKYAYQYATGYELFVDKWKTASQLLLRLPVQPDELAREIKSHSHIVIEDSVNTYILQVTDMHLVNEQMPEDYAREEISQIILSERQVPFLNEEREKLYNEAVLFGKLKIYEK